MMMKMDNAMRPPISLKGLLVQSGERSTIPANGLELTEHSTIPVHIRDIVLMTSRAKDAVSASVECGSDVENVLKSDRVSSGVSSIS